MSETLQRVGDPILFEIPCKHIEDVRRLVPTIYKEKCLEEELLLPVSPLFINFATRKQMIELSGLEADLTRAGGEVPFRGSDIFDAAMPQQQGQLANSLIRKFVIYSTKRRIKTIIWLRFITSATNYPIPYSTKRRIKTYHYRLVEVEFETRHHIPQKEGLRLFNLVLFLTLYRTRHHIPPKEGLRQW